MKAQIYYLLLFCFFVFLPSCEKFDAGCIADIAVTALDAPGAVVSGNIINVTCVIKNVINAVDSCSASEEGTVTVTCAYSSGFHDKFSDYEVFDIRTGDLESYAADDGQTDEMKMPTNQGCGYYAMKVETNTPNDENNANNARAVSIQAY